MIWPMSLTIQLWSSSTPAGDRFEASKSAVAQPRARASRPGGQDIQRGCVSSGISARMLSSNENARDMAMRGIRARWEDDRDWSLIYAERVAGLDIVGCVSEQTEVAGARATLHLVDSRGVFVRGTRFSRWQGPFMRLAGEMGDVTATNNVLGYADPLKRVEGTADSQLSLEGNRII